MSQFALYLLKMSLCSGVLYAYYHLALRNRVFHQYNRFYLLAAVFFSLLFPLIPLPQIYNAAQPTDPIQLYNLLLFSSGESEVAVHAAQNWNWQSVVVVLYIAVGLVLLGRLIAGLLQIRRLMTGAEVQHSQKIKLVPTNHAAAPFSFFNWLFWKREIAIESESGQSIFRHELVHIQEKHTVDKLFLQAVLIFFWINPIFWLLRRELQMIHEFIADKKSVGADGAAALAAMILTAAYGKRPHQFTNAFFQQPIIRRLTMLQRTMKQPQNAYLGRVLALPLCAILLFAFAERKTNSVGSKEHFANSKNVITDTIPADSIASVNVVTKDSATTITITHKNGTQKTYTEEEAREKGLLKPPPPPPPPPPPMPDKALLVIDGKEQGPVGDGKKLNAINTDDIESMNVLKGEHATKKYGEKGKSGAIEIITKPKGKNKKATTGSSSMVPRQSPDIVHLEVAQPPHFPGGEAAWQAFLQKNLNASAPVDNSAPTGKYTVQVQFKVANDGSISDIQTATALGYGMEQEVVALMQKSPKWVPAKQNGYKVTTLHKQKVTFVVAQEE